MSDSVTVKAGAPATVTVKSGGTVGPQGPKGDPAVYVHTQAEAATTWTVNHNLGVKPIVAIYSTGSVEVEAQVTHTSTNQFTVSFSTALAGYARCV
jgi:hypothetical protein